MNRKHVAWLECKPTGTTFKIKFNTKKEGRTFANKIGADIIEWRRGS